MVKVWRLNISPICISLGLGKFFYSINLDLMTLFENELGVSDAGKFELGDDIFLV